MVARDATESLRKAPPKVRETCRPGLARCAVFAYTVQGKSDGIVDAAPTPGPRGPAGKRPAGARLQ